jgi:hypothetical protein
MMHFWKQQSRKGGGINLRWRMMLCGVVIVLGCAACIPVLNQRITLFFSAEVWGGSPFSEDDKQQTFIRALKSRQSEILIRAIPFEETSLIVKRVYAVYEVNARVGLPKIISGYRVELELPADPPERITLLNQLTGVSWSIRLDEALGN